MYFDLIVFSEARPYLGAEPQLLLKQIETELANSNPVNLTFQVNEQ